MKIVGRSGIYEPIVSGRVPSSQRISPEGIRAPQDSYVPSRDLQYPSPEVTYQIVKKAIRERDERTLREVIHPDAMRAIEEQAEANGYNADFVFQELFNKLKGVKISQGDKPIATADDQQTYEVKFKKFIFSRTMYVTYKYHPDKGWMLYDLSPRKPEGRIEPFKELMSELQAEYPPAD